MLQSENARGRRWMPPRLLPRQPGADVLRPGGPAGIAVELLALQLLEVRRLSEQEQLVDRADVDVLHPPEVHAQAEVAQEVERVLAGDQPGVAQGAERAEDLVVQRVG